MTSFYFLFIWILAQMYRFIKRRPILVVIGTAVCFTLLILSFKWGLMCSNMQPQMYMKKICMDHENGNSVGNLCKELCQLDGITSISCQTFHMGKESVFSGIWGNKSIFFKLPKKDPSKLAALHWLDKSNNKMYPSEIDFSNMIVTNVKLRFNVSVDTIDAKKMSYMHYPQKGDLREIEMENVWRLLQDNEYLALLLYAKFDIFPQLVGSCGSLYAVQKLHPISRYSHLMSLYDSKEEWVKRIKLSVMILDFLKQLENGLPEPLHICDVKIDHFGVTSDLKKIQYLDLDSVHPLSIANQITGDGSPCKHHSDCDFFDCRSFCNLITYKCQHGVVNNNLQIVCEKIFLGWVMSGRVVIPGLLLSPRSPRVLLDLLELCANPDSETGTPRAPASKEVRDRLHKLLSHLA